jgi:hypothetical protein
MFKIRASSLGLIMTQPKSKTEILSEGAKTFLKKQAKESLFGFYEVIDGKYLEKGRIVEDDSIALFNTERKENAWITGECDIFTGKKIYDIKSSWNLSTFPATADDGQDKKYEWQLRAYMMLWNVDEAAIVYCMVNTPDELIKYEQEDLHFVDHIDETLRVTVVPYCRDLELEEAIKEKVEASRIFIENYTSEIKLQHAF